MSLLTLNRSILDPVHGLIRLTDEELLIIDLPIFQRLRNIRQNGLLYLVFPSATNTRFEHSIGTLFVADSIINAVIRNSATASKKRPTSVKSFSSARNGEAIDLASLDRATLRKILRLTRVAALVHDLGHGPLSHTFDSFAPTVDYLDKLVADARSSAVSEIWKLIRTKARAEQRPRVEHEAMSCLLFAIACRRKPTLVKQVSAVILAEYKLCEDSYLRRWLPFCHDIIASAPADADRMDYLERDSKSFGVTYGLFDRNRLLKSFLCFREDGKHYRLGIKQSGLRAVENFIQARFELYVQIYYHKTNRAVALMLKEISRQGETVNFWNVRDLWELIARYQWLTDERFMSILTGEDKNIDVPAAVSAIAQAIQRRSIWKRVFDCDSKKHALMLLRELRGEFPQADMIHDIVEPKATKGLEHGARLLRRNTIGIYSVESGRPWLRQSPLIQALNQAERKIHRIFLRSPNATLASLLRQRAEALTIAQDNKSEN